MGHYDDCYEEDYAKQREIDKQLRNEKIPEIIAFLESARHLLATSSKEISKTKLMIGEIEYMKLALQGQLS